ncbi:MAG: hypothetical protein IT353_19830 [Gemmatimonadaceae bacterium]|nr:hypothetical protein [Gemmatimonadaceae bacterium]
MYATCLHCAADLGRNESIEALPIGRRIAFDRARGRLWVVCRACERWNLTPFDTRWEAVEQCEEAFRSTRVRVSTDQIGLARLRDGTDLVRIGAPQRPEFAAWRYGDQFGRRRRRNLITGVGTLAGVGFAASGMLAAGAGIAAVLPILHVAGMLKLLQTHKKHGHPPVQRDDGSWVAPFGSPRLIDMSNTEGQWGVDIGIWASGPTQDVVLPSTWLGRSQAEKNEIGRVQLSATQASPLLRRVLPAVNKSGAGAGIIRDGVALIEQVGGPEHFALWATKQRREWAAKSTFGDTGDLTQMPVAARLAFEMALHEDTERRALEGELAVLEAAWQDAEVIARIADSLVIPSAVSGQLADLKARREKDARP